MHHRVPVVRCCYVCRCRSRRVASAATRVSVAICVRLPYRCGIAFVSRFLTVTYICCFTDGPESYGKYKRMHLLNNLQNCTPCLKQQDSLSRPERNGPAHWLRTVLNRLISHISRHARSCFVHKSLSMPNLQSNQLQHHLPVGQHPLNVSKASAASHNSAELLDRSTTMRTLLPMYALPTDSENKSNTNGNDGAITHRADVDQCDRNQHLGTEHQQQQQHHQQS
uniref:Uncharacterized protein n=1 Tax=Anopheles atroparvus TaxID=41427 RepID=A0AAG5DQR3_ANOAO